jgi:hypothetical protein
MKNRLARKSMKPFEDSLIRNVSFDCGMCPGYNADSLVFDTAIKGAPVDGGLRGRWNLIDLGQELPPIFDKV